MAVETRRYRDFLELMEERYSVRSYSDRPVEDEKLQRILRAGQVAPTGCNRRPQRFYVLRSEEGLKKAANVTRYTFHAPLMILICSDTDRAATMPDGQNLGTVDATIAITHMMLEAWEMGVGSCWVRGFDRNDVYKEFDLPKHIQPEGFLTLGYPSERSHPSHLHTEMPPIEEMTTYI